MSIDLKNKNAINHGRVGRGNYQKGIWAGVVTQKTLINAEKKLTGTDGQTNGQSEL